MKQCALSCTSKLIVALTLFKKKLSWENGAAGVIPRNLLESGGVVYIGDDLSRSDVAEVEYNHSSNVVPPRKSSWNCGLGFHV